MSENWWNVTYDTRISWQRQIFKRWHVSWRQNCILEIMTVHKMLWQDGKRLNDMVTWKDKRREEKEQSSHLGRWSCCCLDPVWQSCTLSCHQTRSPLYKANLKKANRKKIYTNANLFFSKNVSKLFIFLKPLNNLCVCPCDGNVRSNPLVK